jgi:hypothetical protein
MRWLGGTVVALLLVGAASTGYELSRADSLSRRASHPAHARVSMRITVPAEEGPFFGAKHVTLAEAERRAPYARERPDDPAASDATLNTVWATPHQFAFDYESGIEVRLQPWGSTADPASVFAKLVAQFHLRNPPTTISKDPAILVSLDEASPASVEFVRRGIKVSVFGEFPDAVLRRVAESIP